MTPLGSAGGADGVNERSELARKNLPKHAGDKRQCRCARSAIRVRSEDILWGRRRAVGDDDLAPGRGGCRERRGVFATGHAYNENTLAPQCFKM